MLKHIEQVYLFRMALDLRRTGLTRRAVFRALTQETGPMCSATAIRCATNGAFEI